MLLLKGKWWMVEEIFFKMLIRKPIFSDAQILLMETVGGAFQRRRLALEVLPSSGVIAKLVCSWSSTTYRDFAGPLPIQAGFGSAWHLNWHTIIYLFTTFNCPGISFAFHRTWRLKKKSHKQLVYGLPVLWFGSLSVAQHNFGITETRNSVPRPSADRLGKNVCGHPHHSLESQTLVNKYAKIL